MTDRPSPANATQRKPLVSIVIPVYNEELNVQRTYDRVKEVFADLSSRYDYEYVFTDNHSTDGTFDLLRDLAKRDPRVRAWRFSRNYGYQKSIMTAYGMAHGDCAIQLDCDLQDPPEMIPQFLELWNKGYKVVYGVRRSRKELRHIRWMRKIFYRLINALSSDPLPHDAGDFRLVDRRILDELAKISDYHIYIRGRLAAMGFSQIGIPYDRNARTYGESKFKFNDLMKLAIDGIVGHSVAPLRLATWCGLASMLMSILLGIGYFVARLAFGQKWPAGFTTLAILILLNISLNGFLLGIMGEYISRIYQQVKLPPHVIIEEAALTPSESVSINTAEKVSSAEAS